MNSNWQNFLNKNVDIIFQSNDGIVALEKPANILSHPNVEQKISRNALFTCPYSLKEEVYFHNDQPIAYLLNRLDSPVSGLILVGLNKEVAISVKSAFKRRSVIKKYFALLKGHLLHNKGTWESKITKTKSKDIVRATCNGQNLAVTQYLVLQTFSWQSITLSLVELQPITGYTHQLRMHCAQNLVPIIGDKIYGDFNLNRKFSKLTKNKQILLHSYFINLEYILQGRLLKFCAHSKYNFNKSCINFLFQ